MKRKGREIRKEGVRNRTAFGKGRQGKQLGGFRAMGEVEVKDNKELNEQTHRQTGKTPAPPPPT